jgi:RNAse (barnase) inhibitor barstar
MTESHKHLILDCAAIKSPEEFWELYLTIPTIEGKDYFGRNLDAFWDALSAGGPGWPGEVSIEITNTSKLKENGNSSFVSKVVEIGERLAIENASVRLKVIN